MTSDDFIPLTTTSDDLSKDDQSTSSATPTSALANTLAERLKMARVTMEGPERAIARERNEKSDRIHSQIKKLDEDLAVVAKRKEDLEIAWVVLDNKRNDLKKILAPILADEEKAEVKEDQLEGKERTTLLPSERQKIEKERWQSQEERRKIEVKKWELEDKVAFLEKQIADNTEKYQQLLDEEAGLRSTLSSLSEELNIMAEQIRLEDEDKKRRTIVEAELHQKEALAKKRLTEIEDSKNKEKEPVSSPKTTPTTSAPANPVKSREDLLKEAEDNRRRMQEEIARITGNLNTKTQTSTAPTNLSTIPPTKPKEEFSPKKPEAVISQPKETQPAPATAPESQNLLAQEPIKINIIRQGETSPAVQQPEKGPSPVIPTPSTTKTPELSEQKFSTEAKPKADLQYREEISKDDLSMAKKEDPTPLAQITTTVEDKLPKVRTMKGDLANLTGKTEN